ncbi:MAG: ABC transporter permease [Eubacteriales bacterium]|nr:ABC transporter permease [Eubacteriales bacterium]
MSTDSKRSFGIFKKNSELQTVVTISVFFIGAVLLYQIVNSLLNTGTIQYPSFIYPSNILNILQQNAAVGIMALGMTVIMLTGTIDLSIGMMTSLVAIFIAKAVMDWAVSPAMAVIYAVLICVGLELIMGSIISWLNVESFIITLGGMISCRGIALLISNSQEVAMRQNLAWFKANVFDWFNPEGVKMFGLKLNLPYYVIIFFILTAITWAMLKYTKFGRRIYAIGNNPQAAFLSGVNVKFTRLMAFLFNGVCVGIGATMQLVRVNTGIITVGQNMEIDVIAAVVIGGVVMSGGKGSVVGAFIGALLMGTITNAMTIMRIQQEWQFLVKGIIIIAAVAGGALSEILRRRNALLLRRKDADQTQISAKA